MQDLENDVPGRRAGKCRTLKMTDRNPMHKKLFENAVIKSKVY